MQIAGDDGRAGLFGCAGDEGVERADQISVPVEVVVYSGGFCGDADGLVDGLDPVEIRSNSFDVGLVAGSGGTDQPSVSAGTGANIGSRSYVVTYSPTADSPSR